jgi:flagellar hook-basal body complex protein FliE
MRVEPLLPDVAPGYDAGVASESDARLFGAVLGSLGAILNAAQGAEDAFARGTGTLHDAVYERARADVALAVATSAAQRAATAVTSILNMQV